MYYIYGPNAFINSTAFFINLYMHICRITKCDTNEDLDVSIAKLIEGSKLCVTIEHGLVRFCESKLVSNLFCPFHSFAISEHTLCFHVTNSYNANSHNAKSRLKYRFAH